VSPLADSATVSAPDLLSDGMAQRLTRFGNAIQFYAPGLKRWQSSEWTPARPNRFLPVSVTGSACALQCEHCKTKVLEGMISLDSDRDLFATAQRLREQGTDGVLVSGGSQRHGGVPLLPHVDAMRRVREELGMRVVVHSGVVSPRLAEGLVQAGVDGVMLDIIGAEETIREVYHLDLTPSDFDRSLALLAEHGLRIIPHIVLGLHYGRFLGEFDALEMIASHPVSTLILVVLTPLIGTPMGHLPPPPLEEVSAFFGTARRRMPDTRVNLGCGRPMGEMKVRLDQAAVDHGLNGIAYPADGIVAYARQRGLEPEFHEYCCSLTWAEL
jgi:uncharacterized radical SAM superfamily protein